MTRRDETRDEGWEVGSIADAFGGLMRMIDVVSGVCSGCVVLFLLFGDGPCDLIWFS